MTKAKILARNELELEMSIYFDDGGLSINFQCSSKESFSSSPTNKSRSRIETLVSPTGQDDVRSVFLRQFIHPIGLDWLNAMRTEIDISEMERKIRIFNQGMK